MGKAWIFVTQLHSLAGPFLTLLYPLYRSLMAIEGTKKQDVEQWLAYWIVYTFLTMLEMVLQPVLLWIPMELWYNLKLVFVAWLVLPQFNGAAFLYEKYLKERVHRYKGNKDSVRDQVARSGPSRYGKSNAADMDTHHQVKTFPPGEGKKKLVHKPGKRRELYPDFLRSNTMT